MPYRMLALITSFFLISGCVSYSANRYSISIDNVSTLQELSNTEINLGQFTATEPGKKTIMCRGFGPVTAPADISFEEFIKSSLKDELVAAEVYSSSAPVILTGNLDSIDFSSTSGFWNLALTVNSNNGKTISVMEHYPFETSFFGEIACRNSAKALSPAIQSLVTKTIHHPEFKSLLN